LAGALVAVGALVPAFVLAVLVEPPQPLATIASARNRQMIERNMSIVCAS
jgi:hypothetical protein